MGSRKEPTKDIPYRVPKYWKSHGSWCRCKIWWKIGTRRKA